MMKTPAPLLSLLLAALPLPPTHLTGAEVRLAIDETGGVNGVTIVAGDRNIAVYRPADDSRPAAILTTHGRRDLAAAIDPLPAGARLVVPETARDWFADPDKHWTAWWDKRFDYYDQQVTRLPVRPLAVTDAAKDGDRIDLGGVTFEVLATPGVTRDGIAYLAELDGKLHAFTGNLILAGGRAPDLYSFQDAIPAAKVGAYHGYGGRFSQWIASLTKLKEKKPAVIVPSHGPVIDDPAAAIDAAIDRARKIYANYLSTNALHWYFGAERMRECADRVLGPDAPMEAMPLAEHVDLPPWVQHIGTTKLILSRDKTGFVLDVGGPAPLQTLKQALADGLVTKIEGIWVTHRHNDHTQAVRDAQEAFGCPVYAVQEVADALLEPGAHFSPGISRNAVKSVTVMADGEKLAWREYDFTARFFPGQMLDHGGLLVERQDDSIDPVFFIGDSFSPSGIDDYCLMNRNLMRDDLGYLKCLRIVRSEMPPRTWLVNQHIPHLFRFTPEELDFLERRYRERMALVADFSPWDDVNYAVDEQWAWLFPYGQEVKAGDDFTLTLRVTNYSAQARQITAIPHAPAGLTVSIDGAAEMAIASHQDGKVILKGRVAPDAAPGVRTITVSLKGDGLHLPHWCEGLVKVVE